MKTIWKFDIPITDTVQIEMPEKAKILYVGTTDGFGVSVWVLVNTGAKKEMRMLYIRGTGHKLGNAVEEGYIGTVVTYGGSLVWHIFEHVAVR